MKHGIASGTEKELKKYNVWVYEKQLPVKLFTHGKTNDVNKGRSIPEQEYRQLRRGDRFDERRGVQVAPSVQHLIIDLPKSCKNRLQKKEIRYKASWSDGHDSDWNQAMDDAASGGKPL